MLEEVYSLAEAAELWGVTEDNIRMKIHRKKFEKYIQDSLMKKSKGTWIIHESAMLAVFGEKKKKK
jgi:hypothetical protein